MTLLNKYNKWVGIFSDIASLKILFYLKEYNPNIQFVELEKNLKINRKILDEKITVLIETGLVKITTETPLGLSLTDYGRVGVNRVSALIK